MKALFAVLMGSLFLASPISAHQLKRDGDVGALMHIEPTDNPQAGVPATVWFALVKKGGQKIPLKECTCTLTVENGPQRLFSPQLIPGTAGEAKGSPSAQVNFPKKGNYLLVLSGTGKQFKPFTLRWKVRISR